MSRFERFEDVDDTDGEDVPPEFADFVEATAEPFDERLDEAREAQQRADEIFARFLLQEPDTII